MKCCEGMPLGCLPAPPNRREVWLGAYREPVEKYVKLNVSPDLEPLLHEGVGDEVLAEERRSRISPLPCVLGQHSMP